MICYISSLLDLYGNPSSHHSVGIEAKKIINQSRKSVAKFINADESNILFTPSGSASNTLATKFDITYDLYYSPISHKSILEAIKHTNNTHYKLAVDSNGSIDTEHMEYLLCCNCNSGHTPVVMIDYANSEIGTIQDVKSIVQIVHRYNGLCYLDCTGSISSIPLNVIDLDVDMIGFSGHKLGGLKGCGVFYKKPHIDIHPLIYGSQENGIIGGTENMIGIAALGKAIDIYDYSNCSLSNRDYVWNYIKQNLTHVYLVGSESNRLMNNLFVCFKGVSGEALMMLLDELGIQVSTGSACTSGDLTPSPTLSAIGLNNDDIHSCIRITLSGSETMKELDFVCKNIVNGVNMLRNIIDNQ